MSKEIKPDFKPFTLSHEEKGQWCRFEPTDDSDTVFIRFCGACGHVMETAITMAQATDQMAHLYRSGYVELEDPEGFEQKFLHVLGNE